MACSAFSKVKAFKKRNVQAYPIQENLFRNFLPFLAVSSQFKFWKTRFLTKS